MMALNYGSEEICSLSDEFFKKIGLKSQTRPYLYKDNYLVLFDEGLTQDTYDFGKDACVDFSIIDGKTLLIHDLWIRHALPLRQGIGTRIVQESLRNLGGELGLTEMTAYALATETAQGFWRSLDGWIEEGERNFVRSLE